MHVVQVYGHYIGINHEDHPDVLEVLCDECEVELDLRQVAEGVRRELLHALGAR